MNKTKTSEPTITFTIQKFNLDRILPDAVVFCIGKRRSGKSWLIRDLMYTLSQRQMPYGTIYSGTEHCGPFFKNFFPKLFIKKDFTDDDIGVILDKQSKKVNNVAKQYNLDNGKCIQNNMLLCMDDMMSDEDIWRYSKNFKRIFMEGRHYNILFLMSLQYVLGVPPGFRENIDYVFLFASDGNNLKKLYENYAGAIPSFAMFKDIFKLCTTQHSCMVIDRTVTSDRLDEKVFSYRARDPGKFKFGSPAFWKIHDDNYRSEDEEDDTETAAEKKLRKYKKLYAHGGINYEIRKIE